MKTYDVIVDNNWIGIVYAENHTEALDMASTMANQIFGNNWLTAHAIEQ